MLSSEFRTADYSFPILSSSPARPVPVAKWSIPTVSPSRSVGSMTTSPMQRTTTWWHVWRRSVCLSSGIFNNVDPSSNQRMDLVVFDPGRPNFRSCTMWWLRILSLRKFLCSTASIPALRGSRSKSRNAAIAMPRPWLECSCTTWQLRSTKMFTHFVSLGAVVNQSYPQGYISKLLAKTDFGLSSAWSRKCD